MIVISLENYFERFLVSTIPLVHVGADCAKENEREKKKKKLDLLVPFLPRFE